MTRRLPDDHFHPDAWTKGEQHRFEDRVSERLEKLENRITLLVGGLGVLAFLIPVMAPFLRDLLNITP